MISAELLSALEGHEKARAKLNLPPQIVQGSKNSRKYDTIPFGTLGLNRMLRDGGIPRRRVTMVYGESQAGKSTLVLDLVAQEQKIEQVRTPVWFDFEHTFDSAQAEFLGIDLERLLVLRPDSGEEGVTMAVNAANGFLEFGKQKVDFDTGLIVVDSLSAVIPSAMFDADVGKSLPAARARLNADFIRRMIPAISRNNIALVGIAHLATTFKQDWKGDPVMEAEGGKKWHYLSTLKFMVRRKERPLNANYEPVKGDDAPIASAVTVKLDKNKLGNAYGEAELIYRFGEGFDTTHDLIEQALDMKTLTLGGAWYTLEGEKFNGKSKLIAVLKERPDLRSRLETLTLEAIGQETNLHGV